MKKAFAPIINEKCNLLILGTMPGEKSLELQEYYGNKRNQFWKILFAMLEKEFSTNYNKRLSLLKEHNIALWDVLEFCEREGSLDSNIKNEKPNNFNILYAKYPDIKNVFFSSKNAEAYYKKYVGKKDSIVYETLPSPSGANATKSYNEKLRIWSEKILPLIKK